jgi:nucleotide-binding universal stress UspA family protein
VLYGQKNYPRVYYQLGRVLGLMFRYQRILVPLDGSELAEKALKPAVVIAESMDGDLLCLQVVTGLTLDLDPRLNQRVIEARKYAANLYFNSLKSRYSKTKRPIETEIAVGYAPKVITDSAREHGIDLIVLSSHGRTGLARWVYGNVTAKILRHAPCDTLIVRTLAPATELFSTKRLLVPLDGSKLAERALRPAIALASTLDMEILLLRVSPLIPVGLEPMSSRSMFDELEARARDEALTYLQSIHSSLEQHGVPISVETITGPEAATIVDYAKKYQVDLIVMSSHGHTGIGLWLMGSVSEKVLRKASCATLVVRPPGQTGNETRDDQ